MTLSEFPPVNPPMPRMYQSTEPTPRETNPDAWMDQGLCAQIGGDAWFPEPNQTALTRHAKAICATCPVAAQCLQYALDNEIRHGLWGGVTPKTRAAMRNRRAA